MKFLKQMFSTQVLKCNPSSITFKLGSEQPQISCPDTLHSLQTASHHLLDLLQPVVIPTETVYGLAASALNPSAVSKIFTTKHRPPDNPLIVHVSSSQMLNSLLPQHFTIPPVYYTLMKHFWPGPLTLLFPSNSQLIPPIVTAHLPTVAVRMPSHPVARALIAIANTPLAAPSANSSGKPSPTRPEHVLRDLDGKVAVILDGGSCGVGLESTVVDGLNSDGNIRVLRPGGVTVEDIQRVLEEEMGCTYPKVLVYGRDFRDQKAEEVPTTPGMKYRHYSPSVPVTLLRTSSQPPNNIRPLPVLDYLGALRSSRQETRPLKVGLLSPTDSNLTHYPLPTDGFEWSRFPLGPMSDMAQIARNLFDGLLSLERDGVDIILVEEVDPTKEGLAIMNRVQKAAGESQWVCF